MEKSIQQIIVESPISDGVVLFLLTVTAGALRAWGSGNRRRSQDRTQLAARLALIETHFRDIAHKRLTVPMPEIEELTSSALSSVMTPTDSLYSDAVFLAAKHREVALSYSRYEATGNAGFLSAMAAAADLAARRAKRMRAELGSTRQVHNDTPMQVLGKGNLAWLLGVFAGAFSFVILSAFASYRFAPAIFVLFIDYGVPISLGTITWWSVARAVRKLRVNVDYFHLDQRLGLIGAAIYIVGLLVAVSGIVLALPIEGALARSLTIIGAYAAILVLSARIVSNSLKRRDRLAAIEREMLGTQPYEQCFRMFPQDRKGSCACNCVGLGCRIGELTFVYIPK